MTIMIRLFPSYYADSALISENNNWKLLCVWRKVSYIRLCTTGHLVPEPIESIEKIPKEVRAYLDRLLYDIS